MYRTKLKSDSSAFTLVELLVVIAIIGVLVSLLLPAVQAAREAARRTQCKNNLRQLALGVLSFESAKKVLPLGATFGEGVNPATATPKSNWVISILPYIEQSALYDSFDFSASLLQSGNDVARTTPLPTMGCPSDDRIGEPLRMPARREVLWARGTYACNAGNGPTILGWDGGLYGPDSLGWLDPFRRGMMGPDASVKLEQVVDGLTNTILLTEIRAGLTPGDYRGAWALGTTGASMVAWYGWDGDANGPNACYENADDISGCDANLLNDYQSECMSCWPGDEWNDQAAPRSTHQGGVHVAFGDASVSFVEDSIETSGRFGPCCSPWDRMMLSADEGGEPPRPPGSRR